MRDRPVNDRRLAWGATWLAALVLIGWLQALPFARQPQPARLPFQDPDLPVEQRITDLIGRMTLVEKIDALATRASVPRLGVVGSPHIEGYHGVAQGGPSNWGRRNPTATTQFPQAYGLGSTWDPDLLARVAAQEAQEARYLFQNRKYQRSGLIVRAPNADLARDPRWGRTEEVYGEDPFHAGTLATAFTKGLQGDDPRYWKTASLLKHFLANSNEDARERSSSNFDERLWREYYAKPFEMAVRQGGSRALMAAYNAVNGTPAHVHPMLRDIVMREWGLDGILCTDGNGLRLLVTDHKAFPDLPTAAAACMKAGINHFLDRQVEPVTEAVKMNLLTEVQIDEALRGLFRVSIRLGLLDPPERVPYARIGAGDDPEPWNQPETRALVREVTRKSIVLLKNSTGLLPLDRAQVKSVAVVGPLASTVLLDWYSGTPPYAVSPREGIEQGARPRQGGAGPGVTWAGDMSDAAVDLARRRDVAVVCVGSHPEGNAGWGEVTSPAYGKEGVDRKEITLPHGQEAFVRRVIEANPRTVVVLIASYPVALPWAGRNASTILFMTHNSQELGNALADVLFGDANPGGRLAQTWPASLEQLPPMMDYDLRHGRTYMYSQAEPQYAFGYGLSYTRFTYANLRASSETLREDGAVDVSVDVANAGQREGDEVVQLYVRYPESKVDRPRKQLRGFARVSVPPGARKTVTLRLAASDLAYWDKPRQAWVVEPGRVEMMVGPSSADADLGLRKTISVQAAGARPEGPGVIATGARLEKLAGGFAFTEGPTSDKAGNVYFTDQPNNRIMKWGVDGKLTTFMQPAGRANGMYFDAGGNLVACADEQTELWSIAPSGTRTVLAKSYEGKPLNGPNDVWVRPDGGLYFTDPFYKRDWWTYGARPQDSEQVYFLSADRKTLRRVTADFVRPNGIIGTPDGRTLYVADIGAGKTYAFDIRADGSLANKRLQCDLGSDGMTLDAEGNLYLTGRGVSVFDRQGKKIEQIDVPENWTANVAFGGRDHQTLFVTATTGLYAITLRVKGANLSK